MKYLQKSESLIIYTKSTNSSQIKLITPENEIKLLLENFSGHRKSGRTIKLIQEESSAILSLNCVSLRILTGIKGDGFHKDIPLNCASPVYSHAALDDNKIVTLSGDRKIRIIKFTNFGFHENIAESAALSLGEDEQPDEISLCDKSEFIILSTKKEDKSYESLVIMIIRKQGTNSGNHQYEIFKKYQIKLSMNHISQLFFQVSGYWENGPILSVVEFAGISKMYSHEFNTESLKKYVEKHIFERTTVNGIDRLRKSKEMFMIAQEGVVFKIHR